MTILLNVTFWAGVLGSNPECSTSFFGQVRVGRVCVGGCQSSEVKLNLSLKSFVGAFELGAFGPLSLRGPLA